MTDTTHAWAIRYGGDSPMGSLRLNDPAIAFLKALDWGWTVEITQRPDPEVWNATPDTLLGEYLGLANIGGEECIEVRESGQNEVVYIPLENVIDIFIP